MKTSMSQRSAGHCRAIFAVALFCIVIGCFKSTEVNLDHEVVGKWKTSDGVTIAFYKDGVASVEGNKAQWKPIDSSSVRIEGEDQIAEFVITKNSDGGMVGVIELAGAEMKENLFGVDLTYTKVIKK